MARTAPARTRSSRREGAPMRLDRTIHEGVRLAIVSALAAASSPLSFAELKAITGTTDGNLSVHARRLEEAGYVACTKTFAGRVPRSEYRLTAEGRRALERYVADLEAILAQARR
ncbi:MAG TPA: transcriptional regulator [Thermoanaerobaculia bacterium]